MDTTHGILADLAEAQESYRLANARVIEVLGEKMAAERQRDELAATLQKTRKLLESFARPLCNGQIVPDFHDEYCSKSIDGPEEECDCVHGRLRQQLQDLDHPSAILAAREKPLRDALESSVKLQSHYAKLLNMHDGGTRLYFENADAWMARLANLPSVPEWALPAAPETKP